MSKTNPKTSSPFISSQKDAVKTHQSPSFHSLTWSSENADYTVAMWLSYSECCCHEKKNPPTTTTSIYTLPRVAHNRGVLQVCFGFFTCLCVGQSWCTAAAGVVGLKLSPSPCSVIFFKKSPGWFKRLPYDYGGHWAFRNNKWSSFFFLFFPGLIQMGVLSLGSRGSSFDLIDLIFALICTKSYKALGI